MKLSLYTFMVSLAIANIANGMEHRDPSPITLEQFLDKHDAAVANKSTENAPEAVTQKNDVIKKQTPNRKKEITMTLRYARTPLLRMK